MDPIVRIFVSSTQCLLVEERQRIINTILQHGAFPIAQEFDFQDSNTVLPIDKCEEKVDFSDAVLLVINAWYGSTVQENGFPRKCADCQIKDYCDYRDIECNISYTHYEYLYAKMKGKDIYVLKKDCISDNAVDDEEFIVERTKCINECKRLGKRCHAICRNNIKCGNIPNNYFTWIQDLNCRMVSNYSDYASLVEETAKIVELIKKDTTRYNSALGLYPYASFLDIKSQAECYEKIKKNVVEMVFDNQSQAIDDAEKLFRDNKLYATDFNMGRPIIRVLCFRGNSFINDAGALWEKYIFSSETQGKHLEFILANLRNEDILKRRHTAFPRYNDFESFKKKYIAKMGYIENILLDTSDDYSCTLYLHHDAELPFRMLFIGDILYLSFFLNETPASESPVYRTRRGSSLYLVCEEYYNRVKNNSQEVKINSQERGNE